nr:unnamed protein product [Digitaria exilis]
MSRSQRAPSSPCDATWHTAAAGVAARHARSQSPVRGRSATPSRWSSTIDDDLVYVAGGVVTMPPARGSETPARMLPGASPEGARAMIGAASPGTARRVALRLYESLGRHGLRREADRAFRDAVVESPADGGGGGAAVEQELTGMACLLKDGFVGYLRELAKITPPVPKQAHPLPLSSRNS